MKHLFFIGIISYCFSVSGQNLIPNPSFENITFCPFAINQINFADPWTAVWGSPDLFNSCTGSICNICVPENAGGYQNPKDSNGYAGIFVFGLNTREYLQAKLLRPLIAGRTYRLSFYINLFDVASFAIDRFGAYFSLDQNPTGITRGIIPSTVTPQITSESGRYLSNKQDWELITGSFVAAGGEEYINLGNFYIDSNTNYVSIQGSSPQAYYFIDDIELILVEDILANDTTLCEGETLVLNASTLGATYLWQDNSTDSIFEVTQTGNYWVKVTDSLGSRTDTIIVTFNPLPVLGLGNDTSLCEGELLLLNVVNSNATYLWQDGSIDSIFTVSSSGVYSVEVINDCGTVKDTVIVELDDCKCNLFIPNVFTPNGDANNDQFSIIVYRSIIS